MKIGNQVKIIKSNHADIMPGQIGEIVQEFSGGYGVKITGLFSKANDPSHKDSDTRVVWFGKKELDTKT